MLVATREHDSAHARHFDPLEPRPSLVSRFHGGLQFMGSVIGIPLALVGGYATWHANFSPEAKCQALRANIVSMLDKKADASTLRMLVQRDVASFQRDCGEVDPDAVAAFKTLLTAERTVSSHPKLEAAAPKAAPVTKVVAKPEPAKKIQAAAPVAPKREPEKAAEPAKPVEIAKPDVKVEAAPEAKPEPKLEAKPETKSVEVAAAPAEPEHTDTAWVNSVREALREAAARPPAAEMETTPLPVSERPVFARDPTPVIAGRWGPPRPPGEIPLAPPQDLAPRPPGVIPGAEVPPPAAD